MADISLITELDRLHHRATDMRARERQLADAGENDPASDAWKTAAIIAASAESEFKGALVEAWPNLARRMREADQWRARESETQEALQAIGEEFGVRGGEPRVDGIRRVLTEKRDKLAALLRKAGEGWSFDMDAAPRDGSRIDIWARRETTGACDRYTDCRWGLRHFGTEPYGEPVWLGLQEQYSKITPIAWRPLPAPPAAGAPDEQV